MSPKIMPLDARMDEDAAQLLHHAFPDRDGYPTMKDARDEVQEFRSDQERIALAAVVEGGILAGWIGTISTYNGCSWELHPLVVREDLRGRGLGRLLVKHLETAVAHRGGGTMYLGTDDTRAQTTVGGVDLYPGVLDKLTRIENPGRHPLGFYLRMGYEVTGIIPDANGPGKPDIFMARRIDPAESRTGLDSPSDP